MNNKCGIVILNYKSKELTIKLANKLSEYSSVDAICIVDNNSGDVFASNDFNSDKIHFIKNERNLGYNAGNNIGLKYLVKTCGCDITFVSNPDVVFDEKAIIDISSTFLNNDDIAICSCLRYGHNHEIIHQFFEFPSFSSSVSNCFVSGRKKLGYMKVINQTNLIKYSRDNIIFVDAVPGAFFGIRASFLEQIDYLFEGVFLYGEEIILGMEARKYGYKAALINSATYIHDHIHVPFSKSNRKMFFYDRKSLMIFYKKFHLLSFIQRFILWLSIYLGTFEYYLLACLYRIIRSNKK